MINREYVGCCYSDHFTSAKENIVSTQSNIDSILEGKFTDYFVVTSCLRVEVYYYGKENVILPGFCSIKGTMAIRRFIYLVTGLLSEIKGENEIIVQTFCAMKGAYEGRKLSESLFKFFLDLLFSAKKIKSDYNFLTKENYATIASSIINSHIGYRRGVLMVIGAGMMCSDFAYRINPNEFSKVYLVNRNIKKIKAISSFRNLLTNKQVQCLPLDEVVEKLGQADYVFSALKESGNLFADVELKSSAVIVDVSYPTLFRESDKYQLFTIKNTFFEDFINRKLSKNIVSELKIHIDNKYA